MLWKVKVVSLSHQVTDLEKIEDFYFQRLKMKKMCCLGPQVTEVGVSSTLLPQAQLHNLPAPEDVLWQISMPRQVQEHLAWGMEGWGRSWHHLPNLQGDGMWGAAGSGGAGSHLQG